jgi:gamma-glutamyltranspeptidase
MNMLIVAIILLDSKNNWVSMMHTGNGGGAVGIVVDGVYMHGGSKNGVSLGPGRRISLPICPIMVLDDEGPNMALGSPGNPVYSTPIVLANIFEFEMVLIAQLMPRVFCHWKEKLLKKESYILWKSKIKYPKIQLKDY